jgi:hypothetical protein
LNTAVVIFKELAGLPDNCSTSRETKNQSLFGIADGNLQPGGGSRARTGYAAENLATLRRLALNKLRRESTKKRGIKGKQKNAGWDHSYLLRLFRRPSRPRR